MPSIFKIFSSSRNRSTSSTPPPNQDDRSTLLPPPRSNSLPPSSPPTQPKDSLAELMAVYKSAESGPGYPGHPPPSNSYSSPPPYGSKRKRVVLPPEDAMVTFGRLIDDPRNATKTGAAPGGGMAGRF
ncbi:hypothetical protein BDY24DRAFT_417586 [Mrakia frigida]|uniref:uncharacterized protein n=1 Tax=Mrakia frigida TaxID=29902 RepID=UPI003FCC230D